MSSPPIKIRGVRQAIPPGYVLGRLDPNLGDVQLIKLSDLANQLSKTVALRNTHTPDHVTLGFQAPGPFSAGQQFTLAPATIATTFPSTRPSVATCAVTPHGAVTAYLVYDLPAFLASGAPAGVLAEVAFAASVNMGTVTWVNTPYNVVVGQVLTMVMPAAADPAFSTVLFQFIGDLT